jgi:glycosyltransferase involved in cell wall biosynthesis
MPFFSVILPTYNRARMAAAAALSVLAQTDRDFECFVIDDGSTDDTARVLSALPKDPRLRPLSMGSNQGQHACRNRAIRLARGEFVTFLDSDDLYLPGRLAAFRAAALARPGAGFWFSNAYTHRYGRITGLLFDPSREIPQGRLEGYFAVGESRLPYVTTNVAIRREAFERFGLFRQDLRILEDTELYSRMLAGGLEVGAIHEPLAVRFLHEAQITRDYERDYRESLQALDASRPPPEVRERYRREIASEVAGYLWKSADPGAARAFLLRELGLEARRLPLYWACLLPPWALAAMKSLRRRWIEARFSPALSPFRPAAEAIRPFIEEAARL